MSNEDRKPEFMKRTKTDLVYILVRQMNLKNEMRLAAGKWEKKFREEEAARKLAERKRDEQKRLAEQFGDRSRKLAEAVLESNISNHEAQRARDKQTALSFAAWTLAKEHKDDDARPKAETWNFSRVTDDS